ncbi:F-box domain-containing protein [Mycena sanguinolenta]|uniref:F-box domain-containing protein n=1 Tax=Mycena sanguinolenta TaxID=230812 RepID=A0A8H6YUD2_9AGAR|nr:F-box domain-containing protein [Mycena sanguinolenta]
MYLVSHLRRRSRIHKHIGEETGCILPQELVDECLSHLPSPSNELKACALVCRAWCYTAQRLIFSMVSVAWTTNRYQRLEETLHASPHLIQHIRSLTLHRSSAASPEISAFEKICMFPFTHLENVYIFHSSDVTLQSARAMRRLLSLPTLRLLDIQCTFEESPAFLAIWDGCSPSIRHLHLRCHKRWIVNPLRPKQFSLPSVRIVPESLKIDLSSNIDEWLNHDQCPIDISRLAVLAIDTRTAVLSWPRMVPSLQTIEALDLSSRGNGVVDLSLLPNLLFLRIDSISWLSVQVALDTVATIPASSRIHEIILRIATPEAPDAVCEQLDSEIGGLSFPYLSYVGLEMSIPDYNDWASHFPRLCSKDLLVRTSTGNDWFETQIHRRNALH